MPRPLLLSLGLLCACAAVWGFVLGLRVLRTTETEVIERYAQQYLQEGQSVIGLVTARETDCVAYPSDQRGVWIVVACTPVNATANQRFEYHVKRLGGLVRTCTPKTGQGTPQPST